MLSQQHMQAWIEEQIKNDRQKALTDSPQITLGELIVKLELAKNPNAEVFFDFEYCFPTELMSWRGAYQELAIGFVDTDHARKNQEPPTVEEFLKMLRSAVGAIYHGYKGGNFTMTEATPLWVANNGNSSNTGVTGVIDKEYTVYIETRYCEYIP